MTAESDPFVPISDEADHHGPGEVAGNVDALSRLFPDAVVDGTVDLDVLADLLGKDAKRGGTQGFGLRWPGMDDARRLAAVPATQTLLPRPDESVNWDTTRNIVIEGDNLEVLRLLRRGYTGKVDVIYIDPPYNTGNDFVYDDNFSSTRYETETLAGQRDENGVAESGAASDLAADRRAGASKHSKWLSMMYPRLLLAHRLLKETGVIIVAIDDTEHARLRLLLDRIFAAENFAANVVWQGGSKNHSRFTSGGLDYMLIYTKNMEELVRDDARWVEEKAGVDRVLEIGERAWLESGGDSLKATQVFRSHLRKMRDNLEPAVYRYDQIDEQGRVFQAGDLANPSLRPSLIYSILHPRTGRPVPTPSNGWKYSRDTMDRAIKDGLVLFGSTEETIPRFKRFLSEMSHQAIRPLVQQERASASYALAKLLDARTFEFTKDVGVLAKWIRAVSQGRSDALIVDLFAGSGSTGHAVMELNASDGGGRRHVMVQLNEAVADGDYKTIAEIMRERLRRAGKQISEQRVPSTPGIDVGFRSYRLASSNVMPWDGTAELDLLASADNLVGGRSTDDLLVEMMLRLGIDLVTPVETREAAGSTLYSVAGTLFAHFGSDLGTAAAAEVAQAIIAWRDEDPVDSEVTVVVRDSGFRHSEAKLNLAAALQQAGIATLRSI